MEKIKEALKILITGETDAVNKYNEFSRKAFEENYNKIGLLFSTLAMAERIHIKNHLNALKEKFIPQLEDVPDVANTIDNIKTAIDNEVNESKRIYPKLIKSIKGECNSEYGKVSRLSMIWAHKAEIEHSKLLKKAYKAVKSGKDMEFENIYFCQVCGNIVLDRKSEKECTVCGHDVQFFKNKSEDK